MIQPTNKSIISSLLALLTANWERSGLHISLLCWHVSWEKLDHQKSRLTFLQISFILEPLTMTWLSNKLATSSNFSFAYSNSDSNSFVNSLKKMAINQGGKLKSYLMTMSKRVVKKSMQLIIMSSSLPMHVWVWNAQRCTYGFSVSSKVFLIKSLLQLGHFIPRRVAPNVMLVAIHHMLFVNSSSCQRKASFLSLASCKALWSMTLLS